MQCHEHETDVDETMDIDLNIAEKLPTMVHTIYLEQPDEQLPTFVEEAFPVRLEEQLDFLEETSPVPPDEQRYTMIQPNVPVSTDKQRPVQSTFPVPTEAELAIITSPVKSPVKLNHLEDESG